MKSEEKVLNFLENNYGYITTKDILNLKISKPTIKFLINKRVIERVDRGLYMNPNIIKDEYYILQKKYKSKEIEVPFKILLFIK